MDETKIFWVTDSPFLHPKLVSVVCKNSENLFIAGGSKFIFARMNDMEEKPRKKSPGREQLLQKLKAFCAYQERCHQEVRDKAFALGLSNVDLGELMATLIEENYLNEERFAILYAGGKFRMKHWGRIKIKYALKQKGVSEYSIKKALKQIDVDDYEAVFRKVAAQKERLLSGSQVAKKKKLYQFLLSRGFESELIWRLLQAG